MAQQAHAPALHAQKMLGQTHDIAWPALRAVGALLASCGDGKVLCLSAHGIIACGVGLYTVAWQAKRLANVGATAKRCSVWINLGAPGPF